ERNHLWVRIANQRLGAIERIRAYTDKIDSACELAGAKVISIGPHPSFWIISKVVATADREGPTIISSSRIVCLRKRYTLQVRRSRSELRKQPAIGQLVV